MSCNMFSVWPPADRRRDSSHIIILQSLSRFSDGPDSWAVDLRRHAETRFRYGSSGNLAKTMLAETETEQKVMLEVVSAPYPKL